MTIKEYIIKYLSEKNEWIFGGMIEMNIAPIAKCKTSNVSRRCRELFNEEKIDRRLVNYEGRNCVQYRIKKSRITYELESIVNQAKPRPINQMQLSLI